MCPVAGLLAILPDACGGGSGTRRACVLTSRARAPGTDRPLGQGARDSCAGSRPGQRAAQSSRRRLHPWQRVRRLGHSVGAGAPPGPARDSAVAGARAESGRHRGRHAPECGRRRSESQFPLPVATGVGSDVLLGPASAVRARDRRGGEADPSHQAGVHGLVPPTRGPGRHGRRGDRGVARRYAQLAGLRATCLPFLPGTATAWENHTFPGTTSFVVELPAGAVGPRALARHLRAIRGLENGERAGSSTGCGP